MARLTEIDFLPDLLRWITTGQAKQIRLTAGLTLADAAEACEVVPTAVYRWERGERVPHGRNVNAYYRFLQRLDESQRNEAGAAA